MMRAAGATGHKGKFTSDASRRSTASSIADLVLLQTSQLTYYNKYSDGSKL
jgi:hypothetical protein